MVRRAAAGIIEPSYRVRGELITASSSLGNDWLEAYAPARVRNGWLVLLLSFATMGVYTIFWLYRLQREYPRRQGLDPAPGLWLGLFLLFTLAMIVAFAASGFGQWLVWADALPRQQTLFTTGLALGVAFHLWFGWGSLRLTERLRRLTDQPLLSAPVLGGLLLVMGLAGQLVAMVLPPLHQVGLFELAERDLYLCRLGKSLGSGFLFSWAIVLHRQANQLALEARGLAGGQSAGPAPYTPP